jgi:BirA family biotin operon repressor/biotin-[acetyl-CoA-carboxylase] ligase
MRLPDSFRLIELARVDSTNSEALRRAAEGAPNGTVIWAHEQTAGRGRQGRTWQSLAGNLTVSFLLRPAVAPARLPELSLLAGIALCDALAGLLPRGADLALKWPNDVLLGGAKLAGILLESAGDGAVAVGIGVNVATSPADEALAYPATRLIDQAPATTVAGLLQVLAASLDAWLASWQASGFEPVRAAWRARGPKQGDAVRLRVGSDTMVGHYQGLADDGSLLLDTPAGLRRIMAGDVLPLAPAA